VKLDTSGYVLDSLALLAIGTQGREVKVLSGLIVEAMNGEGPPITIPALCLADAGATRKYLFEHVEDLITRAPLASIMLAPLNLRATGDLAVLRDRFPGVEWPVLHAAREAPISYSPGLPDRTLVTLDRGLYRDLPVGDVTEI
jgi:hypothetical protein